MEKRTPHCPLAVVRKLVEAGQVRLTESAARGGNELGFNQNQVISVVMDLSLRDFYKSMTTHINHTVWQDVYRPRTSAGDVYLKLTVVQDVLIVSFKPL